MSATKILERLRQINCDDWYYDEPNEPSIQNTQAKPAPTSNTGPSTTAKPVMAPKPGPSTTAKPVMAPKPGPSTTAKPAPAPMGAGNPVDNMMAHKRQLKDALKYEAAPMTKASQVLARYHQIIEEEPMPRQYGHPGMAAPSSAPAKSPPKNIVSTVKDAVSSAKDTVSDTWDTLKKANPVTRITNAIDKALP